MEMREAILGQFNDAHISRRSISPTDTREELGPRIEHGSKGSLRGREVRRSYCQYEMPIRVACSNELLPLHALGGAAALALPRLTEHRHHIQATVQGTAKKRTMTAQSDRAKEVLIRDRSQRQATIGLPL